MTFDAFQIPKYYYDILNPELAANCGHACHSPGLKHTQFGQNISKTYFQGTLKSFQNSNVKKITNSVLLYFICITKTTKSWIAFEQIRFWNFIQLRCCSLFWIPSESMRWMLSSWSWCREKHLYPNFSYFLIWREKIFRQVIFGEFTRL